MREGAGRNAAMAAFVAVVVSLVVALDLAARPARADGDAAAAPEPLSAEQLAAQAYDLHAAGKYAEAIAVYLKVFELSGAGAALLNVATIYDRKLHERDLAAEYYRRYLRSPDAEPGLVEKAAQRLTALKHEEDAELERRAAEAAATPPATAMPPATATAIPLAPASGNPTGASPPSLLSPNVAPTLSPTLPTAERTTVQPGESSRRPESQASTWRTAGFVVGAAGCAGITAGLFLGGLALAKNNDANMMCNGAACVDENGVRVAQEAGQLATASTVFFIAGLALAGGGLAMVLASPRAAGEPRAPGATRIAALTLSPQIEPRAAGLSMRGGF